MILITTLETTNSTNTYLKKLIEKKKSVNENSISFDIPEFYTVSCNFQTDGRGQKENSWFSDSGKNILLSTLIYPNIDADKQFYVNMAITLGILEFCKKTISYKGFSIKWPNDIYYNDQKIGGVLIEHTIVSNKILYSIVGIGLNINQVSFPENIPNPVSAIQICGNSFSIDWSIRTLLSSINKCYTERLTDLGELKKEFIDKLYRINKPHPYVYQGETTWATITDVNQYGMLCLKTAQGEEIECGFKEISFVI